MKTSQLPRWILLPTVLLTVFPASAQSGAEKPPEVTLVQSAVGRLPADFKPSPALEPIVTLAQSGVSEEVLLAFLRNAGTRIALTPDEIIFLRDLGLSDAIITLLLGAPPAGDAALAANPAPPVEPMLPATNAVPPPAVIAAAAPPAPVNANAEMVLPPADNVTTNQFVDALAPYGNWVNVDGYGLAWQPTVVVINQTWRPYADCGRWVWSNHGWYWSSDYSWGWAPFHYGRWVSHPSYRWVWCPDTQWGPSWVSWRYSPSYCGWAPLPPTAYYRSGVGFSYKSQGVGIHFEFGLGARDYCYVPTPKFCHPRPVTCAVPYDRVHAVHQTTTVANNYIHNEHNVIINRGISPNAVALISKSEVPQVAVTPGRTGSRNGAGRVLPDGTRVTGSLPGRGPSRNDVAIPSRTFPATATAGVTASTPPSTPVGSTRAGLPSTVRGETVSPGGRQTIHTVTRSPGVGPRRSAGTPVADGDVSPAPTVGVGTGVEAEVPPPAASGASKQAGNRTVVLAAPSGSRYVPPSPMIQNRAGTTADGRANNPFTRGTIASPAPRVATTGGTRPDSAGTTPATPQVPQPTLPATSTSPGRAPTLDARLSTLSPRATTAPSFPRPATMEPRTGPSRTTPSTPQVPQAAMPVTGTTPRSAPPALPPSRPPTVDARLSTLSPRATPAPTFPSARTFTPTAPLTGNRFVPPPAFQPSMRSSAPSVPQFNGGGMARPSGVPATGGGSRFVPPTPATGR